jgi:hypothetical protein
MVGGDVKEVLWLTDRVWVNAKDRTYADECAIYVERNSTSERIKPGDAIWWQSRMAMWTPAESQAKECGHREHITCLARCGIDYDIQIPRIGYSGVAHPGKALIDTAFPEEAE